MGGRSGGGRRERTASNSRSSKKPCRTLRSTSMGMYGFGDAPGSVRQVVGTFQERQLSIDLRVTGSGLLSFLGVRLNVCGCYLMRTSAGEVGEDVLRHLYPCPF